MGNCLKTQLKEAVQNSSLKKLGEANITFSSPFSTTMLISTDGLSSLNIDNGEGKIVNNGAKYAEIDVNGNLYFTIADGGGILHINPYYNLTQLNLNWASIVLNIDSLEYATKLIILQLNGQYVSGNISSLKNMSLLKELQICNSPITGTIESLKNLQLNKIQLYGSYYINGDVAFLSSSVDLNTLNISTTQISGSIDDLASGILSKKNTRDGSLVVTGNGYITYKSNGDGTGDDTIIPNNVTKTITFDGAGGYSIV